MLLCFLFFSCVLFADNGTIITINTVPYSIYDFYSKHPKKQWQDADSVKKDEMINKFISRELCVFEAKKLGLNNDPDVSTKLYNRYKQLLINESYEHFVAAPLINQQDIERGKINAKRELFVKHILIGHSESQGIRPNTRSVDEAFLLAQKIIFKYNDGESFESLAINYSEDPSVVENSGVVGWVKWGATVPNFQNAIFSTEKNIISSPVLTKFGYHIILVSEERLSEFQYMNNKEYNDLIINLSKNPIRSQLRDAAIKYDKKMIDDFGVYFNINNIKILISKYFENKKNKQIANKPFSLVKFLDSINNIGVICIYNKMGLGTKWFARKIENLPPSRHPVFNDEESVLLSFKNFILQDIAIQKALEESVDTMYQYTKKYKEVESSILYDSYLKFLINTSPVPTEADIKNYYNINRETKYKEDNKIIMQEIKVSSKTLADSLLNLINNGGDFTEIANTYGIIKSQKGELIGPFSEKQSPQYYKRAASLKTGENSAVFSSTNSTFSIIKLIDTIDFSYVPLDNVYKNIEGLLIKEMQDSYKKTTILNLFNNNNIKLNLDILH